MKALIVDDDIFVRKCITQMLPWQDLDFSQVLEAANGAVALEIGLREKPDLIITDVKMPMLDGLELSKKLRDAMVDICIILLSEYSDFEFAQKAIKCGVHDYILKPLTCERLTEICSKIRQAMTELEMRRYYTALKVDHSSIKEVIREMLENTDAKACMETFEYIAMNSIHRDDLKHFGLMFLYELFEQVEPVVISKKELENLRSTSLLSYSQIKNVTEMIAFVKSLCVRCFNLSVIHSTASTNYVKRIVDYIESNYADPDLSVTKISDWLHLSPIYTGALFKKNQGKSIVSYIHEVRLRQAMELLKDISISVKDVSLRVGYMTPDYFTRLFNASVGVVPSKYRSIMLDQIQGEMKP